MSAISFGKRSGKADDQLKAEQPMDGVWIVLEAANDVGDHATVEICRRVIDADLKGMPASSSDLNVIMNYFR